MTTLKRRSATAGQTGQARQATENRTSISPRHPLAMPATVSIEMWERFSFYGMQAILVYYLYYSTTEGGLGLERTQATTLIGAYGAYVYLCALAGGWIADRILGAEKTLLGGCSTLMLGHLTLSTIPGATGAVVGLGCIAAGSGLVKTAAITILGHSYPADDARRDTGFQLFYLGINLGAVLGPLLTGWLSSQYGFHAGFFAAFCLMAVGMTCYLALRRRYLGALHVETAAALTRPTNPTTRAHTAGVVVVGVSAVGVVVALLRVGVLPLSQLATLLLCMTLLVAGALFVSMFRSPQVSSVERRRLVAYIPLFVASCAFWSVLNQSYGVFAVYSDVRLNRTIGSVTLPAAWTQSLNPFYIVVLSVPLAWAWTRLGTRAPATATKMGVGVVLTGLGMLVLVPFAGAGTASTPFVVLALCILVVSLGELLVGPVGMSTTATHAPASYRTRFSALFFLTMAIGTAAAGVLSRFYNPESASAELAYFLCCGLGAIAVGFGTIVAGKKLHG